MVWCVFLGGCLSPSQPGQQLKTDHALKQDKAKTAVDVRLNTNEVPVAGSPEEELLFRAESKGMGEIFKTWLNSGFLFMSSDCPGPEKQNQATLISREDQLSAGFDEVSNSYFARFLVEAAFRSCRHLSGRIVRLSEGKSITGQYQEVILRFDDLVPEAAEGYFLVARQDPVENTNLLRLIGGGKIQDITGKLATGLIQKVRQEIKAGDTIFLVRTRIVPVEPADQAKEPPQPSARSETDEVVVQPRQAPQGKKLPAEPK